VRDAVFGHFSDWTVLPDGGFAIADLENHRIRRVLPDGRVWTVWLDRPSAITDVPGSAAFVDGYRRVRLAEPAARPSTSGPGAAPAAPPKPGQDT
jgi:hypothetical protein